MLKTNIRNQFNNARVAVKHMGKGRLIRLGLAFLIVSSTVVPIAQEISTQHRYNLSTSTIRLVGETNPNLAKKITYDAQNNLWQFNKDGIKAAESQTGADPLAALKSQVGGAGKKDQSLYSVDLPQDGKKGARYYDNNTNLSFTVVPKFSVSDGQVRKGKLVYPILDGAKIVYTAKNNGMKEDIVLSHNIGNTLQFRYQLNLPETLQAKILADGSVGIYSADPALFGNISFGTGMDREKVESARKTAVKDHLLFAIPAPVIKQTGSEQMSASAQFRLEGSELILYANNMSHARYPVSLDPSVVVTSSSDFTSGNNESNIDFPANQINRGGLTGGTVGTWASTNSFTSARYGHASAVYNGYIYILGGYTGSYLNDVQYAPINSNGTVGTWNTTTSFTTGRYGFAATAYNGYLYVIGGYSGSVFLNDVQYAPINANGTVGTWNTTTAFTTARYSFGFAHYNGYMYVLGGWNGSALGDVQYAPINANGTVGTWNTTTAFTTARYGTAVTAYNGNLYLAAGRDPSNFYNDVQYAPINVNGTVGTWNTTNSITTARSSPTINAYNGYLYFLGGGDGSGSYSDVQYAAVNANGSVGKWNATSSFTTSRNSAASEVYGGYIYEMGGTGAGTYNDVQYVQINPAGATGSYAATTALATARRSVVSVAYNGFLYAIGGNTNETTGELTTVSYATINSDGTIGAWANTTAFTTQRAYFYAAAYNGYMYVVGGRTGTSTVTNTVYYSAIASNGTVGAWTATTSFTNGRQQFGGAMYNGYIYVMGGDNATGTQYNDVQFAAINADGTLGAWHYTHNSTDDNTTFVAGFTNVREGLAAVASGGYLYVLGGWRNSGGAGTYYNDVQYAPLNANGTIGTWATTTSFTTTRQGHSVAVANGYIYIAGGSNASYQSDVQYAPLNANGTIGTWATTTGLMSPGARANFGMVYNGGFMYEVGGFDSGSNYLTDVQFAQVNNGGAGTLGTIATTTALSSARRSHATVAYKGYLYVIGGGDSGTQYNTVLYAPINANGTVGSWTTDSHTFTNARYQLAASVYNGYLYVIGGWNGTTDYKDVQYAPIGGSGALSANFASTNDFSTNGRREPCSAAYNGYLYAAGGWDGSADHNDVRYAAINANGTVGTWADSGNTFSDPRSGGSCLINNGYFYYLGGDGSSVHNDVQYAVINSNGTLGAFKATNSFNGIRKYFAASVANGYMYIAGGATNAADTTRTADTQYAPINANGTVGVWRHTVALASALTGVSGTVYGGYFYTTGGFDGSFSQTTVSYQPMNVISRKGQYSKLMDFGSEYALSNITYNGLIPGGLANISVKTASATGTFGTATLGSGLSVVAACTAGTNRYAFMIVTLDDTQMAAFPDSLQYANVTDITVNYVVKHPDPNVRLRGGKYFAQELLQPLDACGP